MTAFAGRYLVEVIVNAACTLPRLLWGKPQIWSPESNDGDAWRRSPMRALFWSRCCLEVVLRWSSVSLSASMTTSLSGVEQRGLDACRVMIYMCRAEELSGVLVALTVGWTRSVR
jgi:hypothetical protein